MFRFVFRLLLLCLLPHFIHALNESECRDIYEKVVVEWERSKKYVPRFSADSKEDPFLCCQKKTTHLLNALDHLRPVLWHTRKRRRKWQKVLSGQAGDIRLKIRGSFEKTVAEFLKGVADGTIFVKAFQDMAKKRDKKLKAAASAEYPKKIELLQEALCITKEMLTYFKKFSATLTYLLVSCHGENYYAYHARGVDEMGAELKTSRDNLKHQIACEKIFYTIDTARKKQQTAPLSIAEVDTRVKELEAAIALYDTALTDIKKLGTKFQDPADIKKLSNQVRKERNALKKEAKQWPQQAAKEKKTLEERLLELDDDAEKLPLLKTLAECGSSYVSLLEACQERLVERDKRRLTDESGYPSDREFEVRENERISAFYSRFPHSLLQSSEECFYTEQFHTITIRAQKLDLAVQSRDGHHLETIALPTPGTSAWQSYIENGLVYIPKTKLTKRFGIHLRIYIHPEGAILSLWSDTPDISVTINDELRAHFVPPPPKQLSELCKPSTPKRLFLSSDQPKIAGKFPIMTEKISYPLLDAFVKKLERDPMVLAAYVQNEIALVDPFLSKKKGVFQAPSVHRTPETCFLEKQGSPWEICSLLVYFLRKAGCQAAYATGKQSLSADEAAQILQTTLQTDRAYCNYPAVHFAYKKRRITLYPWMKATDIQEGYDIDTQVPDKYATSERFIRHYLLGDEEIFKHTPPSGESTPGRLFLGLLDHILRIKGYSLADIGQQCSIVKKQYTSWSDFPKPKLESTPQLVKAPPNYAQIHLVVSSHECPKKNRRCTLPLTSLNMEGIDIFFTAEKQKTHTLHCTHKKKPLFMLPLDEKDATLTFEITYSGNDTTYKQPLYVAKGTCATLFFHTGWSRNRIVDRRFHQYTKSGNTSDLLAFIGATYFEKCSAREHLLAGLYKTQPPTLLAFGLAKFTPENSGGGLRGPPNLKYPQVDMHSFQRFREPLLHPKKRVRELMALLTAERSAQEYQILYDFFSDSDAVSAMKLLQLAQNKHRARGYSGRGFLTLTAHTLAALERNPEEARRLYFSQFQTLDLERIKSRSAEQWAAIKSALENEYAYVHIAPEERIRKNRPPFVGSLIINSLDNFSLISDGNITANGGSGPPFKLSEGQTNPERPDPITQVFRPLTKEPTAADRGPAPRKENNPVERMPFDPDTKQTRRPPTQESNPAYSPPHPIFDYGSDMGGRHPHSFPNTYFPDSVYCPKKNLLNLDWESKTTANPSKALSSRCSSDVQKRSPETAFEQVLMRKNDPDSIYYESDPLLCGSDIRPPLTSVWNVLADPVDAVSGAFYIDEVDLSLPGPFPLEIRRNYSSQASAAQLLGNRWKLSFNPTLVEQEGLLYAAEVDGSVIVYRYVEATKCWQPHPEDNPKLYNHADHNPYQRYIQNNVLYGPDGQQRIFKDGLLRKWIDAAGNSFTFSYTQKRLSRIVASYGASLDINYNHSGRISEIIASDGRCVHYNYDSIGNLTRIELPSGAVITYEYDHLSRIIRESKPNGKIIENVYDKEGRVIEQKNPIGSRQLIRTSARFVYEENKTTVYDALDNTIVYLIEGNEPHTIIDPKGYSITKSYDSERNLRSFTDKRGLTTEYTYDAKGNLIAETITGEDLTGDGLQTTSKYYTYNENNLCICETAPHQTTKTTYDEAFPYFPKTIQTYISDTPIATTEYRYDDRGRVVEENVSGRITLFEYNAIGFPTKIIQKTGTKDPDLVTECRYNKQGQCVWKKMPDALEIAEYDISGQCLTKRLYNLSKKLLSKEAFDYNLSGECIRESSANPQKTKRIYYNASGKPKAIAESLPGTTAYTLIGYDKCENPIHEVDPLNRHRYRTFDGCGNVQTETKGELTTRYTYEAGGFIRSITDPSGATTTHTYTTNGLPIHTHYPDGSVSSTVYDSFARPVRETKNARTVTITYDDVHRTATLSEAGSDTTYSYDQFGNPIAYTDALGNTWHTYYDQLGRVIETLDPEGQRTKYSYQGDSIHETKPNGEYTITRLEAGKAAEIRCYNAQGECLASESTSYDPTTDTEITTTGSIVTRTKYTPTGQPLEVKKGDRISIYEYDVCGNRTASIDGEGRRTEYSYDLLDRVVEKKLPNKEILTYSYDAQSNLIEYGLPDGRIWKAAYDTMGRKRFEALCTHDDKTNTWVYTHANGRLTALRDPLGLTRRFSYDAMGRLIEETSGEWSHIYTYDAASRMLTAERQKRNTAWFTSNKQSVLVERSYDALHRIIEERTHIDDTLHSQTTQTWTPSTRTLTVNGRPRTYTYQNGKLTAIETPQASLSYVYDISGVVVQKTAPGHSVRYTYTPSGFPLAVLAPTHEHAFTWDRSGKLIAINDNRFTYNALGELSSTPTEKYRYKHNLRIQAPHHRVTERNSFARVTKETLDERPVTNTYDAMGRLTEQNNRVLQWDPWSKLLQIGEWEAVYDALGRRLQTSDARFYYDPETEFEVIAATYDDTTYQKLGARTCDAVTNDTSAIYLEYNLIGELIALTSDEIKHKKAPLSPYGPRAPPGKIDSLLSYAASLTWHGMAPDTTGLFHLGARYYDPSTARFLSPDPVGFPVPQNLYVYANGDPANYFDSDGRFAALAYERVTPTVISIWNSPRFQGVLEMSAGASEIGVGASISNTGLLAPLGGGLIVHGVDYFLAGYGKFIDGTEKESLSSRALHYSGLSQESASAVNDALNAVATLGPGVCRAGGKVFRFAKGSGKWLSFSRPATSSVGAKFLKDNLTAKAIAGGHAFEKHVIKQKEYLGISRSQFEHLIRRILKKPSDVRGLKRGRIIFWGEEAGTIVIYDPKRIDSGTAFKPRKGKQIFYNIIEKDKK